MRAAYTNKPGMAPYRAAGRPPAVFAMERAIDLVARQVGMDPAEVRFRNVVQPDQFPYRLGLTDRDGSEVCYDSGDYPTCLRKAIELADVAAFRRQQEEERTAGRYLGLGLGCYVESTGRGPFEGATVRVEPSGEVVVMTGSAPQGQSHETTLAQLCADRLGVNLDAVTVVTGDTAAIPLGVGTYASRSAVVAGNAVSVAARAVRDKAIRIAAQMLETVHRTSSFGRGSSGCAVCPRARSAWPGSPVWSARRRRPSSSRRAWSRASRRRTTSIRSATRTPTGCTSRSWKSTSRRASSRCCAMWLSTTAERSSIQRSSTARCTAGWARESAMRCSRRWCTTRPASH